MSDQPHFLPYQVDWINDDADIKVWEKSRRIGATYAESWEDLDYALTEKRKVYFSSADESAAREYIDYIRKWAKLLNVAAEFEDEVIIDPDKDINALQVKLPDNVTINALTSNPKRFRSKGGKAVWDEAAWHEDPAGMWDALEPTTMWGDPVRILSTHNGKRFFYGMIEDIRQGNMPGSMHRTTLIDAVGQGLLDKIRGHQTTKEERQAWIAERHRRCRGEDQWAQEYMCEPVDAADAFLTYEMIAAAEDAKVLWEGGSVPDQVDGNLYLGMDIGRRNDISVIWIDEKLGNMKFARLVKPLEKVPFSVQKEILYGYLQHPQMRRACIDETGIGMQLAEQAQFDFGQFRVEPVYFTNNVKEEMAYDLRTEVESKTCVLPASQPIREDLHSLRKATTKAGNIRFDVESGAAGHADYFWGKALANNAAKSYGGPVQVGSRSRRKTDSMMRGF